MAQALDAQSEALLQQALGFLLSPKVQASDDVAKKKGFLKAKGLSDDLVQVAFDRASLSPPAEANHSQPQSQPQPTPAPAPAEQTPYSSKFMQVMMAVQRGEDLPGVRTIDDKPRDADFKPVASDKPTPVKPWQRNRTAGAPTKPYVAGLNGGPGKRYVKPEADPRQAGDSNSDGAPPPVGDKLTGLKDKDSAAAAARDELLWEPLDPQDSRWVGPGDSAPNLGWHNGREEGRPTLVSIDGLVFDVSTSASFSPECGYNALAGRDASRSLAVMSLKEEELTSNLDGCTEEQLGVLNDWVIYFKDKKKYPLVGRVPSIVRRTTAEIEAYPHAK